jgi:hypothetical protein
LNFEENILFKPFFKQEEFIRLVFTGQYNVCVYGGAIRGGKTFVGLAILIMLCKFFKNSRWAIVRTDLVTMRRTTYVSFQKIVPKSFLQHFDGTFYVWTFKNGSQILFFPENYDKDKDLDRFKGLEVNGFLLEEFNELQEKTFDKCIERAGTHFLQNMPPPLIIATCNPTDNWVKKRFYEKYKENTLPENVLYYPANSADNPYIPAEVKASWQLMPRRQYERFVEGNWDVSVKEGDEFYDCFDFDKHLSNVYYDIEKPLHLSFDENVLPYLAVTCYQVHNKNEVHLIDFIPAKSVSDACNQIKVRFAGHKEKMFIYGDATSQKTDAKLNKSENFFTLILADLKDFFVEKRVPKANPPVSLRGIFMNRCFLNDDPVKIRINKNLQEVVSEMANVKQDREGGKMKKIVTENGRSFQRWGHISDTMDYFICEYFKEEYRTLMFGYEKNIDTGSNYFQFKKSR